MSECVISLYNSETGEDVTFRGTTVSEALAMKAEYLFQISGQQSEETETAPTEKPSGFLARTRGGE